MLTSRYIHASWSRPLPGTETSIARFSEGGKVLKNSAPQGGNGFEKPQSRGGKGFENFVRKGSLAFENRHLESSLENHPLTAEFEDWRATNSHSGGTRSALFRMSVLRKPRILCKFAGSRIPHVRQPRYAVTATEYGDSRWLQVRDHGGTLPCGRRCSWRNVSTSCTHSPLREGRLKRGWRCGAARTEAEHPPDAHRDAEDQALGPVRAPAATDIRSVATYVCD
jgi:hypothetical protein